MKVGTVVRVLPPYAKAGQLGTVVKVNEATGKATVQFKVTRQAIRLDSIEETK